MKIGILGGTFNPVHLGHTAMAEYVMSNMGMDKICFLPNGQPPHKKDEVITPVRHRLKMLELAISDNPDFYISDYEARQNKYCYTVDTAKYFNTLKDSEYYFIIGADSLFQISTWKSPDELLKICRFIVCDRLSEGNTAKEVERLKGLGCDIRLCAMPLVDISSTDIRQRVKGGLDISDSVDKKVKNYIKENNLYL